MAPILEALLKNEMGSSEWSTETLKEQQQTEYRKECQQKEMVLGEASSLHNHNADQSIHNLEDPQTSLSGKPSPDEETEQVFTTAHVLCKCLQNLNTHIYILHTLKVLGFRFHFRSRYRSTHPAPPLPARK